MSDITSRRVAWLDILRTLCAIQIVGFHWLRATVKLGLLGDGQPTNFVISYRQLSWGVGGLHYLFLSHASSLWLRVVENTIGLLFEFGWQAVHVFVLLSGFSLALTLGRRPSMPQWWPWLYKRIERVIIPFYLISLPLVAVMLVLSRQSGTGLLSQFAQKLMQNSGGDITGTLIGQILLFDPRRPLFIPVFLSPAWWFVPAILVGYLVFPAIWVALKKWGASPLLLVAFAISVLSYTAVLHQRMPEFGWYFVALNEAFNFCLGAVLGRCYVSPQTSAQFERYLKSRSLLLAGIGLAVVGNVCNLYLVTYPISSSLFTIGLAICGGHVAVHLSGHRIAGVLVAVDSYVLYLLHQPFAFPLAVILMRFHVPEVPVFGLLVYLALISVLAWMVTLFVQYVNTLMHSKIKVTSVPV